MEKDVFPSPAQLALAMTIVKHKPAEVSIKEHILQIRKFIKAGNDNTRPSFDAKFFDSVSFWQQAFEKSEAEQSKLLDRIYELEQRNELLTAKLPIEQVVEEIQKPSKRKANATTTARKRAKTPLPSNDNPIADEGDERFEFLEETAAPLMRQIYVLQKVLQKRPNRSIIIQSITVLCKTVAKELINAVDANVPTGSCKTSAVLRAKQPDIIAVLHGVEHAFRLLYEGLGKVSNSKQGTLEIGQVTYHIVTLYQAIMEALQHHCKTQVQRPPTNTKANPKPAKSKQTKLKQTATDQAHQSSRTEDDVAFQITRLLGTATLSLDLASQQHQNLMEGFLYILLSRVGTLLSLFTFQDLKLHPDLRANPTHLPPPKGLAEVDLDDHSLHAAQNEAKYLIWLLERMLALIDASPSGMSPASSKKKAAFVSKVKEQLQSTLLQAVFGEDQSLFSKSLKCPKGPDADELDKLRACTKVPVQTASEWFMQEVWRLLGWEMLESGFSKT